MARSPGEAVFDRELTELRILSALLGAYGSWASQAIVEALRARTTDILDIILQEQFEQMVYAPVLESAVAEGYEQSALTYLDRLTLLADVTDVLKALQEYAAARNLSKRATRNLMRDALAVDSRILERVPEQLVTIGGKGAPKLISKGLPFVERGQSYRTRFETLSRTLATGMDAWGARRQAEAEGGDLRWVTMRDNKVRPAHVHAQGQTVAYDEPFYVGGYPLWFPGDPSAPDDLTVNCRCVLAVVAPPNRRIQRFIPPSWLNAAGGLPGAAPSQARAPKGTPIGGQWIDTPNAILRSLNRLRHGSDLSPDANPTDLDAADAERTRLADEVLAREGRPGVQETADRLAAIYDRTTPKQRAEGEKWYEEAQLLAQEMADNPNTDLTEEQAGAIIAHLSTQTRWEANADYARSLASGMTQDEALAHLREGVLTGRVPRPKQGGDFIYDDNWQKALNASASDDPIGRNNLNLGTFSEANKTRTFAANILGDKDGVTVDVWMQRLLGQSLLIPAGGPQLKFPDPKTGKLKVFSKKKREDQIYESLSQALRVAAKQKGISPREMQAITWGWGLANYTQARSGHPGRFIDGDLVLPDVIGGEQALIDSGDLIAGLVYMPEPRPLSLAEEPMPDYYYAQAEHLLGLPRQTPPELEPEFGVNPALTAAGPGTVTQARAPKGTLIGGQWIDTPNAILANLGWAGEEAGAPSGVYTTPDTHPPDGWDPWMYQSGMDSHMPTSEHYAPDQVAAIGEYTGQQNVPMNTWLREGRLNPAYPGSTPERVQSDIAAFDSAFTPIPGDTPVYRGVGQSLNTDNLDALVGSVIADKGYLSTSLNPAATTPFAGGIGSDVPLIRIVVPKGTPVVWPGKMATVSGEMEVVLPHGLPLAIIGWHWDERMQRNVVDAVVAQSAGLTASASQVRAPKGTVIGGQWIDTPSGILAGLGWSGESPDTPNQAYDVPTVSPEVEIPMRTMEPMDRKRQIDAEAQRLAATQPVIEDVEQDIRFYTATGALNLNTNLRAGARDPGDEEKIANLDAAIASGSAPYDMYVYRTMPRKSLPHPGNNPFAGESTDDPSALVGQVLADKAYLSTSVDSRGAGASSDTLMRIAIPKGHPILWAEPYSHNPGEYEVMLGRDTPLAITGIGSDPWGDPVYEAVIAYLPTDTITAAGGPDQARAPQGTPIGGEWIQTPAGLLTMVRDQGGASIDPLTGLQPTDGYMVAVQGFNEEVPESEFFGPGGADRLVSWMDRNREALGQPGGHVGLWHDTANGEVVFDVSQRVDDLDEAIRLGGERNQQAIWDVAGGEEVSTGGTGDRQASAYRMDDHVRPATARRTPARLGHLGRGAQARVRAGDDRLSPGAGLTFTPNQARAPKGTEIGGQWIDTPSALRDQVQRFYEDRKGNVEQIGTAPANQIGGGGRAKYAAPLEDNSPASALQANPSGGVINCQKTTTCYEMRRRGMDVVATTGQGENVGASKGLGDYFSAANPTRLADVIPFTDNATGKAQASAEFLTTTHGPNTRGSIQMTWMTGGAHVFNWEVDGDGKVHYMDAQVGREITGKELTETFRSATAYGIRFQRLDNVGIGNPAQDVVDQALTPLYGDPQQAEAA